MQARGARKRAHLGALLHAWEVRRRPLLLAGEADGDHARTARTPREDGAGWAAATVRDGWQRTEDMFGNGNPGLGWVGDPPCLAGGCWSLSLRSQLEMSRAS